MQVLRSPWLGLEIWQSGTRNDMFVVGETTDRKVRVPMTSAPFEIRFPKQPASVAVEICAWNDDSIFALEAGVNVDDIPFFAPGTALPDTIFGSGRLFLDNHGHNRLVGTRIQPHSDTQDKVFFSSIWYQGRNTPLQLQEDSIYLTIFMNKQVANIVNFDEYEYMLLEF